MQKTECGRTERDISILNNLLKEKKEHEKSLTELSESSKKFNDLINVKNKERQELNKNFLKSELDLEKVKEDFKNTNRGSS